ncbi:alpha-(1-_6)-mannopyranosyltransferase A [Williamsia maris]|uniref:Alpha-(1->6)-mannopyranosyltransferase A n=2 Tax=Williamsia maris TaxID=72806 RepID=A0ABT1HFM5_9NOCA|nr:alpha-1,6-mannosyltransferase [Williamsia maris]
MSGTRIAPMEVGVERAVPRTRGANFAAFLATPVGRAARLGFIGSLLVTLGSFGVGDIPRANTWLQDASMAWVTYGHGKSLSGLLFWAGVALMVVAWVRLGRVVLAERIDTTDTGDASMSGVGELRWAAAAWAAPLMLAVPVYSRDVYAYLAQGALLRDGLNPYVDGPASQPGPLLDSMAQVWATTTAPYGPFFVAITRGVTEITGDHTIPGVLLMRLVMLPGWALAIWAVPRLAAHVGRDPRVAAWLVVFNPMLVIHLVAGPHVEMLMAGVLVAGVVLALRGHHVSGLLVLGVAVSIKVTAGIAIPFVLWIWLSHIRSRRDIRPVDIARVFAVIVATTVAVFGAFTLVIGHGFGWLNGLGYADRIINWLTLPTAIAHVITYLVAPFTAIPLGPVLSVSRTVGSVVLAVALVWTWWRFRRDERSAVVGVAVAMFAVLLLEPSTLPWYYSWALVFAGAAAITRRWLAVIVGACVFMLIVFQPDDSILLYEPTDLLLAAVLAGLAGWSLCREDPLRLRRVLGRVR